MVGSRTSVGSAAICCLSCVKASSASVVQRKSPFFVYFLSVLNKGSDLSADLDRNLFKPANFPFSWDLLFRGAVKESCGHALVMVSGISTHIRQLHIALLTITGLESSQADAAVLLMVTIPPSTGNFSIPWAVDRTARIAEILGLPIMPLYGDGDLITIKFIQAVMECSLLPIITGNRSCPIGHIFSPVKPVNDMLIINVHAVAISCRGTHCIYLDVGCTGRSPPAPMTAVDGCCDCYFWSLVSVYWTASVTCCRSTVGACRLPWACFTWQLDRVLGTFFLCVKFKRMPLATLLTINALRGSLLKPVFCAFPTNVELNMWHHTGCGQFSMVAADSKIFRWSSGSPVPS
ncbi:hypothetical protein Tco_0045185 [Tanacetum coccineum]